jgi:hypothetical protein
MKAGRVGCSGNFSGLYKKAVIFGVVIFGLLGCSRKHAAGAARRRRIFYISLFD